MFRRVMDYLKNNQVMEAGMSFASDCNKKDINLGFLGMFLFKQTDKNDLIRLVCGYHFMPDDLKKYYDNPEKAFIDYS